MEKRLRPNVNEMIIVNLFTTITNANFDKDSIIERIKNTLATKEELIRKVENQRSTSGSSTLERDGSGF